MSADSITALRTFICIVERGNFSAAAKALGISAPAVSKQMHKLENGLGVELLTRNTRTTALTEAGELYYEQCKRILREIDESYALLEKFSGEPSGELYVISNPHYAKRYITPKIATFLRRYNRIRLKLELAERIPDMMQEKVDILIGMGISASGEVIQKRIQTTRYILCASPNYLKTYGIPSSPQELFNHHYLSHSARRPYDIINFKGGREINLPPYASTNDTSTLLEWALAGMGIVKLHDYVVSEALEQKKLVEILPGSTNEDIPIYVAYPVQRYLRSAIRVFIDAFATP